MLVANSYYGTSTTQHISQTRKLLLQFLDIKQNTDSFDMDIKILINNPVLSHTSRRVGNVSPMKCLSNNEQYKQVRGISLRSMQSTQYSFPLRSPEFNKHSISQKKLLHKRVEMQSRHKKTLTVPNFPQQDDALNRTRGEFSLLKAKKGKSKIKNGLSYLRGQANFLKGLLRKKCSVAVSVRNSPRGINGDSRSNGKVFDEVNRNEYKKNDSETKKLKENNFTKHKSKAKSNRNTLTLAEKIEQLAFNLIVN